MKNRNYGIDALRIVSMLFVVTLHCLGHGGVLENAKGWNYAASYGLEAVAYCAVNCFVLITGYCSCKSVIKSKRITSLWFQAFFYSVAIVVCLALVGSELYTDEYFSAAFTPVLSNQWWFFTQYFALVFAMPFLNIVISQIKCTDSWKLITVIGFVFTLLPIISGTDLFKFSGGYSFIWFISLYLTGGALCKLADNNWHPSACKSFLVYIAAVLVTWIPAVIAIMHLGQLTEFCKSLPSLYAYTSPTVFISSIALFCAFKELPIHSTPLIKIIEWFAPSVFAVYLISDHRLMRARFITDAFIPLTSMHPVAMIAIVLGYVISIFVVCIAIEKVRKFMFDKLRITSLINSISRYLDVLIERAFAGHKDVQK